MALVDDKLLGYKQQNYASSSEDEGEEEKPCCDEKGGSIAPPSYLGPKVWICSFCYADSFSWKYMGYDNDFDIKWFTSWKYMWCESSCF